MKKLICALLALAMLLGCAALAEGEGTAMRIVTCPEQDFATLCRPEYTYDLHPDGGLTLMLDGTDDGARVSIFKTDAPGSGFDADYYFNNTYPSLLNYSYGDNLLNPGDYTVYTLSGREMPGMLSLYSRLGETWMRFCAFDLRDDCFVRYEAFCPGVDTDMERTLTAVAVAVGNFQPDAGYYSGGGRS